MGYRRLNEVGIAKKNDSEMKGKKKKYQTYMAEKIRKII